jgi:hypothetical protein
MENETKTWLYDIMNAIQEIESFFLTVLKNMKITALIYVRREQWKEISKS